MTVSTTILRTAIRLVLPLSLLFAIFTAAKGHNEPGGGFIAGLITSVALVTYRIANGPGALLRLMPVHPRMLVVFGLALALGTGIGPLFFGEPFLTSFVGTIPLPFTTESIHYSTAVIFDIGVLFVVVGVSVGMIIRLSEELEMKPE